MEIAENELSGYQKMSRESLKNNRKEIQVLPISLITRFNVLPVVISLKKKIGTTHLFMGELKFVRNVAH